MQPRLHQKVSEGLPEGIIFNMVPLDTLAHATQAGLTDGAGGSRGSWPRKAPAHSASVELPVLPQDTDSATSTNWSLTDVWSPLRWTNGRHPMGDCRLRYLWPAGGLLSRLGDSWTLGRSELAEPEL